jgi:hypothetical protein
VFRFGVLPLARKTGAGNILIGDEYDTSMKSSYRGITHYEGLYDQSRYFDRALTRYYTKKGWNTCQFSILRGLSEMLIEKILAKRYPDLQKHQVSCHAAHLEGDRAFPCGKCEKCRRIVAMLKVLGESPLDCGYTDAQVKHALAMIEQRGKTVRYRCRPSLPSSSGKRINRPEWELHPACKSPAANHESSF